MSNIQITQKSYVADWQNISPWLNEIPYLPPWGKAQVTLRYVAYASYIAPGGGQRVVTINASNAPLPATWNAAVGVTFSITIPADWEQLGFRVGGGLKVLVDNSTRSYIIMNATILSINAQEALIRIDSIYTQVLTTPLEEQEDTIAFVQDLSALPVAATLVRDGEEGAFMCPLSLQPPQTPNPNALPITPGGVVGTWYVQVPWSVPAVPVSEKEVTIGIYHFLAVQTQADLQRFTPQTSVYTNTLYLLFGIDEKVFTKLKLRTSQINCWEDNTSLGLFPVTLSGVNGSWSVTVASGSYTTLATYVALHNDSAAHTAALSSAAQLVQTGGSNTPFTFVPPNPRVVGVAVLEQAGRFGAYVSNAVRLLTESSKYTLGAVVNTSDEPASLPYTTSPHPWDAVLLIISSKDFISNKKFFYHSIRSLKYFLFFRDVVGHEYLLEEAIFSPPNPWPHTYALDISALIHFPIPLFPQNTLSFFTEDKDIAVFHVITLKTALIYLRTYLAKYLRRFTTSVVDNTLIPATAGVGVVWAGVVIEDDEGVHYATAQVIEDNPPPTPVQAVAWTTLGTWSYNPAAGVVTWSWAWPAKPQLPAFIYRCAIFVGDFSQTPVLQGSTNFPHSDIVVQQTTAGYTVTFTLPSTPARYVCFVRLKDDAGHDFAEYYVVEQKPPLPTPPQGVTLCPPCVPSTTPLRKLVPEAVSGLTDVQPAGEWLQGTLPVGVCPSAYLCPLAAGDPGAEWVDITLHFANRVMGRWVEGEHELRAQGVLRRSDDELEEERFVSTAYKQESLIRAYKRKYELELFIAFPCLLWEVELIKFAKRVDISARQGLVRSVNNLIPEEFSVSDLSDAYRVRITLREEVYREEHRYK